MSENDITYRELEDAVATLNEFDPCNKHTIGNNLRGDYLVVITDRKTGERVHRIGAEYAIIRARFKKEMAQGRTV